MNVMLRAIGVTYLIVVASHHIDLSIWQCSELAFGSMLILGSFD